MNRPYSVEALPNHRIQLVYPDGVTGVIDLSSSVGEGVFTPLTDNDFFSDCPPLRLWTDCMVR